MKMTTRQKLLIGTALGLTLGAGFYGTRQASTTRRELQELAEQGSRLDAQVQQLTRARDESMTQLAIEQEENKRLAGDHADSFKRRNELSRASESQEDKNASSIAKSWPGRVALLKQCLDLNPEARIPEMQLLEEEDWLIVVKDRPMQTGAHYRQALSSLRSRAEGNFVPQIQKALNAFKEANNGRTPSDFAMLHPHFDKHVDPAILARWSIVPRETVPSIGLDADFLVTQMSTLVDPDIDYVKVVTSNGVGHLSEWRKDARSH
jgi:hypothetical protein